MRTFTIKKTAFSFSCCSPQHRFLAKSQHRCVRPLLLLLYSLRRQSWDPFLQLPLFPHLTSALWWPNHCICQWQAFPDIIREADPALCYRAIHCQSSAYPGLVMVKSARHTRAYQVKLSQLTSSTMRLSFTRSLAEEPAVPLFMPVRSKVGETSPTLRHVLLILELCKPGLFFAAKILDSSTFPSDEQVQRMISEIRCFWLQSKVPS